MRFTAETLEWAVEWGEIGPHSLEPMHGWRSSHDERGHSHCLCCFATIYRGDPIVGRYLKYVSAVFCPECVADNPDQFREWSSPVISND